MAERSVAIKLGTKLDSGALANFDRLQKRAKKLGKALRAAFNVGKFAGAAAGIAAVGFLTIGIKNANTFGKAMAEVSTIVDTAQVNMGKLEKGVIRVSSETGKDAVEVAKALYQTISSGAVDAANSIEFLNANTRAAVAGVASISEAVDITTNIMNAYGKEVFTVGEIHDVVFKSVELGKTTFSELAASMGEVLPFAAQLNVGIKELFGAVVTLTKGGIQTSSAVTFLKNVLASTLKPTKQVTDAAKRLGIDFSASALQSKGFVKFLDEIKDKTRGETKALAELFPNIRGLTAILSLVGKQSEDFAEVLEKLGQSTGATSIAFNKMQKALRLDKVINEFKNLSIKVGETFLPIVTKALGFLADKFKKFDESGDFGKWLASLKGWVDDVVVTFRVLQKGAGFVKQIFTGAFNEAQQQITAGQAKRQENKARNLRRLGFESAAIEAFKEAGRLRNLEANIIIAGGESTETFRAEQDRLEREIRNRLVAGGASRLIAQQEADRAANRGRENGAANADTINLAVEIALQENNTKLEEGLRARKEGEAARAP